MIKLLTQATTCTKSETSKGKGALHKRMHTVGFHLQEISRKSKTTETKQISICLWSGAGRAPECKWAQGNKEVLIKLDYGDVIQLHKFSKNPLNHI